MASAIVVGAHGYRPVERMLGTTAAKVANRADTSVLVVRAPLAFDRVHRDDYRLLPFVDRIGLAYGAADVAVARAGGSVWELAAAGLPAVLVPGDFATGGHQEKNARWFERAGGAVVVAEREAGRVPAVVDELLLHPERLRAMADAMRAAAKADAAERIADELVELASSRR